MSSLPPDPVTSFQDAGPMRLLLVEDGRIDARIALLSLINDAPGEFSVRHVLSLADALAALDAEPFELVITDLNLPDSEGADTVAHLSARASRLPIVVLSGVPDAGTAIAAYQAGAREVLLKSQLQPGALAAAVRRIRWNALQGVALDAERARVADLLHVQAALLDAMPQACLLVDGQGWVERMNTAALHLLLRDPDMPGGLRFLDLLESGASFVLPGDDQGSGLVSHRARTRHGGLPCHWQALPLRSPDGRLLVVLVQVTPAHEDA